MDSQAFGACQCCTQATFLTRNLDDARNLTDQFLVLAPLLLALTAATPFLRGLVADTDTRWQTFQQCWDDRREDELESIRNSRVSPSDMFIGSSFISDQAAEQAANDIHVPIHNPSMESLQAAGVDHVLSRHVAHLLARDAIAVVQNRLGVDDSVEADHWEQLQGTNWNNVRFKPPPQSSSSTGHEIGWRVEFRSPEVQLTDFENAGVVAVIRMLAEIISDEKWDLVIPVSLCEENDVRSASRRAACGAKFWFRTSVVGKCEVTEQSLTEILGGDQGIFTRCRAWLDRRCEQLSCSSSARSKLESYMKLFESRAAGTLPTPATFLRRRLQEHPAYNNDGVLPMSFVHDLCVFAAQVNQPEAAWPADLLGDVQ